MMCISSLELGRRNVIILRMDTRLLRGKENRTFSMRSFSFPLEPPTFPGNDQRGCPLETPILGFYFFHVFFETTFSLVRLQKGCMCLNHLGNSNILLHLYLLLWKRLALNLGDEFLHQFV